MYSNKMCRTCLCSGMEMRSLFDEKLLNGSPSAADILRIFTSVSLDNNEGLPDHICIACSDEIHRTYLFKLKCEESESILLRLKESKVDAIKLEDLLNDTKSESANSSKFQTEGTQLYNTEKIVDYNNLVSQLNEISSRDHSTTEEYVQDVEVTIKNEPGLDIGVKDDDIGPEDVERPSSHGPIVTNHVQEKIHKIANEEIKFEQSANHLPPKCMNDLIIENQSHLCQELMKQSNYDCKRLEHPAKHLPPSHLGKSTHETPPNLEHDLTNESKDIKIEPIQEHTSNQSAYEEDYTELDIDESIFSCSICPNERFEENAHLDRHNEIVHTDIYGIKCSICSARFSKQTEFIVHMSEIHNETEPAQKHRLRSKNAQEISAVNVFKCGTCSEILPDKAKYIEHMRSHTSTNWLQCKLCSKKFEYRYSLKIHVRNKHVNDGKPDYQCNVCSKIFGSKHNLDRHMRIHNREDPFQCNICLLKFRRSDSLKCHMRRRHMNIQTGVKPYDCKLCSEKFRYSHALKSHMERKHPNEAVSTELGNTEEIVDYDDFISNHNAKENRAKLTEISSSDHCVNGQYVQDFEVTIKNEPELDVDGNDDDIGTKLKDVEQSPSQGPIVTNHVQENIHKIASEEFEQSTKHLLENQSHLRQELMKQSNYECNGKNLPPSHLQKCTLETPPHLEQETTKQSKDIKIEPIKEHSSYQSEYEEDYTELDVDESIISCSICPNEKFEEKAHLNQHNEKVHTDIYGIKCSICSVRFSKQTEFMVHMSRIHNETKPALQSKHTQQISAVDVFECEICSEILPDKAKYIEHIMKSHTANPFQCNLCSKKFEYRYSLKSHMRFKHAQEFNDGKPDYQCSVCSKIFSSKYNLNSHMRVHTREKPFQCKLCSVKFRHSESLTCHMRTVHPNELTDGKPGYQCNICSKIFGFHSRLVRHMHIHTGEKPYDCKLCSEKFRYNNALKRHMEREHPNEAVCTDQ